MYIISVCYGHPKDPAAFDTYYTDVHTPLALKLPGLAKFTTGKCVSLDANEPPYYLVANLYFDTAADLKEALSSPEMRAAGADVANFASGGAVLYSQEENVVFSRS